MEESVKVAADGGNLLGAFDASGIIDETGFCCGAANVDP
jgi:hypothetical protein